MIVRNFDAFLETLLAILNIWNALGVLPGTERCIYWSFIFEVAFHFKKFICKLLLLGVVFYDSQEPFSPTTDQFVSFWVFFKYFCVTWNIIEVTFFQDLFIVLIGLPPFPSSMLSTWLDWIVVVCFDRASGGSTRKTYSVSWNTPSRRSPQYLHGGVTLFLEKAQLSDSGEYTCTVFDDNIPRRYDEKGFQVTVYCEWLCCFTIRWTKTTERAKKFRALKVSNICQQNVSKHLWTLKFSLPIMQMDNHAFTHSSVVKELSHIRSANKVTGKAGWPRGQGSGQGQECWSGRIF